MRDLAPGHFRIFIDREHQATRTHRTRVDFWDVPVAVVDGVLRPAGEGIPGHMLLTDARFTKREE